MTRISFLLALVFAFVPMMATADAHKDGEMAEQTIVDIAAGSDQFTTLVTALKAADLAETLQGEGPFTVFAPTDAAFADLPAGTLDALLEDTEALTNVLTYHVVSGKVMSGDLLGTAKAATVEGSDVMFGLTVNGARVIQADIKASNGVIHVIDSVILPPKPTAQ